MTNISELTTNIEALLVELGRVKEVESAVNLQLSDWWNGLVKEYGPHLYETMRLAQEEDRTPYKPTNPNPWVPTEVKFRHHDWAGSHYQLYYEDLMVTVLVVVNGVSKTRAKFQDNWIKLEDFKMEKREPHQVTALKAAMEAREDTMEALTAADAQLNEMFQQWWAWYFSKNRTRILRELNNCAYTALGMPILPGPGLFGMSVKGSVRGEKTGDVWNFYVTLRDNRASISGRSINFGVHVEIVQKKANVLITEEDKITATIL